MNNIMLDIETMGNTQNSAIVSIGAARFNAYGVTDEFQSLPIKLESSIGAGLHMDASTVMWWMKQSEEARSKIYSGEVELGEVLVDFAHWINESEHPPIVWGNGAMFDNSILGNAYDKLGMEKPWAFWNDRCYRTVKSLYPNTEMERIGVYHHAVDDAKSQVLHLLKIIDENNLSIEI